MPLVLPVVDATFSSSSSLGQSFEEEKVLLNMLLCRILLFLIFHFFRRGYESGQAKVYTECWLSVQLFETIPSIYIETFWWFTALKLLWDSKSDIA